MDEKKKNKWDKEEVRKQLLEMGKRSQEFQEVIREYRRKETEMVDKMTDEERFQYYCDKCDRVERIAKEKGLKTATISPKKKED